MFLFYLSAFFVFIYLEREGNCGKQGTRMGTSGPGQSTYDLSFKILLIGDSAVGKSSLLVSFISNVVDDLSPTVGISLLSFFCCELRNFLCCNPSFS